MQLLRTLRSFVSYPYYRECLRGIAAKQFPVFLSYPINPVARHGFGKPTHPELYRLLDAQRASFVEHTSASRQYAPNLLAIPERGSPESLEPYWNNGYFPALDAIALYSFIAKGRPRRYMEIGSGNSTKFAKRAIRDHSLSTRVTSIDPFPRAHIDTLADAVVRQPLEEIDLGVFDELERGDILFFDGSHRTFMNSDVTVFFLEVLPRLSPGVLVQIHDIFLPNDYPPTRTRHYESEQYLLATMLLGGCTNFDVILANNFVENDHELCSAFDYFWAAKPSVNRWGSSFWLSVKPRS